MTLQHPRCTTDYKLAGPVTFRRASKKKFGIWGSNLQNPSKPICGLYHADPGMLLCQADQSGADAKIVAYITGNGMYRQLFLNKIKPHVFVALHQFHFAWRKLVGDTIVDNAINATIPELKKVVGWKELEDVIKSSDNWPGETRFYFIGKKIGHSSNYGMRGNTFRKDLLKESGGTIAISTGAADLLLGAYHRLFPEIMGEFHATVRETIMETRTLRSFQGFPRYFGGLINEKLWREAYAFIPAATVAIITAQAITAMQNYIEDNQLNWHLLNDKHDSMLVEAPEQEIMECAKKSKEFMEQTLVSHKGETLQMGSGVCVGYNWNNYDSKKNPNGLKEI